MDAVYALLTRVRALFRRSAIERDLNDELEFHIDLETQKNIHEGMPAGEARRAAVLSFGAVETHKEVVRDRRSFRWIEDALSDARYALRGLRRSLGFTAVSVLTLGIGIGATTAIFTVVNAVLLRPLPYPDANELAIIFAQNPERNARYVNISYLDYKSWKEELKSFERLGIFNWTSHTLSGDDAQAERVSGAEVDADLFRVLGTEPLLGRGVRTEEEVVGRNRVIVLGYGVWQRRYGGDPAVLGRTITVNGEPHVVIGVMPAGFQFPYSGEVWVPMAPDEDYGLRGNRFLAGAVGRLRTGVTRTEAEAELARVSKRHQIAYPDANAGWEGQYVPLRDELFGTLRPAIVIVFAAAGLVLLIVCGNLAGLLLARSASRKQETALRAAIGAGRGRLLRQFLTETSVLTLLGGCLALVVAYWGIGVLRTAITDRLPTFIQITPDLRVYSFALAVTAFVAFLSGILPAVQGTRVDVLATVKDGGRRTVGPGGSRLRGVLVIAEVGLAVVLLIGSALLIKSMAALQDIESGFEPASVLTARYNLPESKYDTPERRALFLNAALERIRALPGVMHVGAAQGTPFSGWNVNTSYMVEGEPAAPAGKEPMTHTQAVTPEFFEVLGVPIVRGRLFDTTDKGESLPVAIVNEAVTSRHFPTEDPIGKRIQLCCGDDRPWLTIVGVIRDYRHYALRVPMTAAVFVPSAQQERSQMTLAIRTAGPPADMIPALQRAFAELDPDVPAFRVQTLDEVMARQTWVERMARDILTAFAATAALLAVIGLYGVIAYSVARQRHEIGIRLALGAAPRGVLRLVVRRGLALAFTGIALGTGTAFLAARFLRQLLFQVQPVDSATFILVPLVVALLAALAAWIPARRAASTDPMIALRAE